MYLENKTDILVKIYNKKFAKQKISVFYTICNNILLMIKNQNSCDWNKFTYYYFKFIYYKKGSDKN